MATARYYCAITMVVGALSCFASAAAASAATTAATASSSELQTAANTTLQSFFAMEADVQLNAGYTSIDRSQAAITTAAGSTQLASIDAANATDAEQLTSMMTRHANAAALTLSQGGPVWDSVQTTLTNLQITSSSAAEIDATVDVSNVFHIKGQPHNGGMFTYSAAEDPYSVVLNYVSGEWRLASVQLVQAPDNSSADDNISAADGSSTGPPTQGSTPPVTTSSNQVELSPDAASYSISAATAYAHEFYGPDDGDWNNLGYESFAPDDCMNFVSQIIRYGGEQTGSVWYPYSSSWVNVEQFDLSGRQWFSPDNNTFHFQNSDNSAIHAGDLTAWHWGNVIPEIYDHEMYVDAKSGNTLLLAAHTNNRWNYPSYDVYADEPSGTWYIAQRPNGA